MKKHDWVCFRNPKTGVWICKNCLLVLGSNYRPINGFSGDEKLYTHVSFLFSENGVSGSRSSWVKTCIAFNGFVFPDMNGSSTPDQEIPIYCSLLNMKIVMVS